MLGSMGPSVFCIILVMIVMVVTSSTILNSKLTKSHGDQDHFIILQCGTNKAVCSGELLKYRCNVSSSVLIWEIGPYILQMTFSKLDTPGESVAVLGFNATLLNVTKLSLLSEIQFFTSEKYNNTKFYCIDGVTGKNSTNFCSFQLLSLPGPLPKIDGKQQDDQIHLSWKASTHDIITHYVIQVNPPPYAGNCASGECNTTDTNFTITEIQECENYVITVQAANCAGVGNTTSWNATHYDVPGSVQNLTTNMDSRSITVNWENPLDNGGKAVNAYIVSVVPAPQSGSCAGGECLVRTTTIVLTGLESCVVYEVGVEATNCRGVGTRKYIKGEITTGFSFDFSVAIPRKVITSCNDTLDIKYQWAGCSQISVTFYVAVDDMQDDKIFFQNDKQTVVVIPGSQGLISLPIHFSLKNKTDYWFSITAYNKDKPLTGADVGILSSEKLCPYGVEGVDKRLWFWLFVSFAAVAGLLLAIICCIILLLIYCIKKCKK